MPLRLGLSLSIHPPVTLRGSIQAWIAVLLSACSLAAGASQTPIQSALGLPSASSGMCQAIAALPDLTAVESAITNLAHEALHSLAADPRLDRPVSARILEAMENVEADFSQTPDVAMLSADLAELRAATDAGLRALGLEVPACAH
jgi:hypothetical protein